MGMAAADCLGPGRPGQFVPMNAEGGHGVVLSPKGCNVCGKAETLPMSGIGPYWGDGGQSGRGPAEGCSGSTTVAGDDSGIRGSVGRAGNRPLGSVDVRHLARSPCEGREEGFI
jgi:hypothetical protein